ncbi:Prefoldin, subunit 4 [Ramicandelaber brevisporus]|nr:Prefoldin, subunit 4 [Ramicandelaber brevisporus]
MNVLSREKEQDTEVEVTWEDQSKINAFSRLNRAVESLELDLAKVREDQDALEDLASELELVIDEDEPVPYKQGDAFVLVKLPKAQKMVQKELERRKDEADGIVKDIEKMKGEMGELKVYLYAKFKGAINLDK